MPITIGSNIASLKTQRQLGRASDALSATYERLSSGQRINKASDDAAGLSIASQLSANTRIYSQGIRNVSDAISAQSIAEAAGQSLTDILVRIKELAEQAANGTYSTKQRTALDTEAQSLRSEYHRVIATTSFNGLNLLTNGATQMYIQTGGNAGGPLAVRTGIDQAGQENTTSALLLDGVNDLMMGSVDPNTRYTGTTGLTLEAWINPSVSEVDGGGIVSMPWNGGGVYDYSLIYNSSGQLGFYAVLQDASGNGNYNYNFDSVGTIAAGTWTHVAATISDRTAQLWINGSLSGQSQLPSGYYFNPPAAGINQLGLAVGNTYPYPNGSLPATNSAFGGSIDEVRVSKTARYTSNFTPQNYAFADDDNTLALFHFEDGANLANTTNATDPANPGTLVSGASLTTSSAFSGIDYGPLFAFNLKTVGEARNALDRIGTQLDLVTASLGKMGADRARLNTVSRNLSVSVLESEAARSRIMDADIARESAELVRQQIIQQAGAAVLSQANLQPQLALRLLAT